MRRSKKFIGIRENKETFLFGKSGKKYIFAIPKILIEMMGR